MQKRMITTFEEAENYINETPRFTTKNSMEDTKAFLAKLGNPDTEFRIIHVAGTNGKGSVCAYMRSVLETAGYKVAVFTSPHLVDIRERFVIQGEMITKEEFLGAFLQIYDGVDWEAEKFYHPTYFEFLFFIAMLVFAGRKPDFCILETGLGGRLDATNSVARKEVSVITRIGLDHVQYLGDTMEQIAGEKAGIMQAGAPVVYWDTGVETSTVFKNKAEELGIIFHPVSKEDYQFLSFHNKSIDFSLHTRYYKYVSLTLNTIAVYQMENAALAVRALEVMDEGKTITAEQIQKGISGCFWAGRMEEVLPEVYVDGAHNEDGIRAFLETVALDGHVGTRALLFGVVRDKDYEAMVKELAVSGCFERVAIAHLQTDRGVETDKLSKLFADCFDCQYEFYENAADALRALLESRGNRERIYVAGSLYLVGEIKELLKNDKF